MNIKISERKSKKSATIQPSDTLVFKYDDDVSISVYNNVHRNIYLRVL